MNREELLEILPWFESPVSRSLDVGDGWLPLIERLVRALEVADTFSGVTHEVVQVKEKFGGLRYYINGGSELHDELIGAAEALSYETCEECGEPGALVSIDYWQSTLCLDHVIERARRKGSQAKEYEWGRVVSHLGLGIEEIAQERWDQQYEHGFTRRHDQEEETWQGLVDAAKCYAEAARYGDGTGNLMPAWIRDEVAPWPWEEDAWKPSADPVANLRKSGALIAAAIDHIEVGIADKEREVVLAEIERKRQG